jgi:alpha-2-macroglobulin
MGAAGERIRRGLRAAVGEISWQPPQWVSSTAAFVHTRGAATASAARANPQRAALIGAAAVALVVGAVLLWRWYENRPRPVEVTFAVIAPPVTCYACDPPRPPNPLLVRFDTATAPLDRAGHTVQAEQAGISMSPQLAGQWTWDDDKVLRFQPASDWPIGQHFEVSLSRKTFAAGHVRLRDYRFEFDSPAFLAKFATTEFYQDPVVAANKKAVVNIAFTHPVDPESFERRVRLAMFERVNDKIEKELTAPTFTVTYDKLKLNAYVHSGQVEVPAKSGRLHIAIAPGVHAARGGNETRNELATNVDVPGLNSLKISNVVLDIVRDQRNEPDQVLLVTTSFPVLETELPAKVHAWLLPMKHPDADLQKTFEYRNRGLPFPWNASNLRLEVLRSDTQLQLAQLPGERDHYELHSLRYEAEPGRYVYVKIDAGLRSFGGYRLGESVERIIRVPEFPRELSILHQGSLLSMSGEKTLSLFARNVRQIRVEVNRLLPRQLQHLVTQSNGNFATPMFSNWSFDAANVAERFIRVLKLPPAPAGKAQYEAVDLGEFLDDDGGDRRGVFLVRVQDWDGNEAAAREYGTPWNNTVLLSDARLLVVTDLGLVTKRSVDGSHDVFVQSIATGAPVAGATVEIIGRNGLPALSETTDSAGHVRFPDLESFKNERAPVLYLARRGGDSSFLPLDGRDRRLDFSRFDVGGVESNADRGALAAYIFSDRGIYRPGEQIRAAAIVRSQDWSGDLDRLPLRLEVTDPRGIVVRRETYLAGAAGFGEILHSTKEASPTGTYTLSLSIVRSQYDSTESRLRSSVVPVRQERALAASGTDLIGSTTVQVRDFQPDRLRMKAGFSAESLDGWVSPESLEGYVHLENLFGTPAENRRITAQLTLNPSIPSFRAFPDYTFYDPQYAREGYTELLAETTTNAQGDAKLTLNLQRFARATYRMHLVAQGFEADGGRGVTAEAAQLVSSMPFLIGYKADGDLQYLPRAGARNVHFIAINPQARAAAVDKLMLARLETRYVSVLMRQQNGTYKYESRRKETTLEEKPLSIPADGFDLPLATDAPGNFAYEVRDAQGERLARFDYQVAGEGNVTRTLEKNAELQLTLSKRDYAPGEEIELSIRAPYAGAGLITVERERVYAWHWFKSSTTGSVQRLQLPDGLEGNAYVTVTFVRDAGSPEIYTSPLSYGVQPFSIDVDARRNQVTVESPALTKPGQEVRFRYSSARPSRLVLFAVDEGILQVASYRTPDPLGHFFAKRALEVSTLQILDLILPEFRQLGLAAAPGGDAEGLIGKHLNPFRRKGEKPVAYWSGIVEADSTPRELKYVVPDYFNGTLRVMAVAVSDDRIGVYDGRTLVRGDFVLSPNAPTTLTPGDEFDVSVGVANNVAGSGQNAAVAVSLQADPALEVVGDRTQQATIAEGHEGSVRFRVRTRDELGAANLTFSARSGVAAATRRIDLSVRPATPYMTQIKAGVLPRGQREIALDRSLYPHYRTLEAGASMLPLQFAHGFVSYLGRYPYMCTEQIVSQAMPAVLLKARPEFGYVRTEPGADIAGLVRELRARQNDAGAYKLWPGSEQVVEFVALYAQHFLLEAAERDEPVPGDLIASGNVFLRSIAARDGNNLTDERQTAYAIYLLTRQGTRMSTEIAAARKRLEERYRGQWEQDLTAAWLAAALDLMRQDRDAGQLIGRTKFGLGATYDTYNDPMTRDALLLFVISKHFPERLRDVPKETLLTLAQRMNDNYYHSLSAGTTLLALDAYSNATQSGARNLTLAEVLRGKRVHALELAESTFPKTTFSEQAAALRFTNNSELNAYYTVEQSGFDRKPPTTAIRQGFELLREYTDASGEVLTSIQMGQQVDVHLKFRSIDRDYLSSMALVDLLPGGFELVVPSQDAQTPVLEASTEGGEGEAAEYDEGYAGWTCQVCVGSKNASMRYADMREDRVVFYVDATKDMSEIVYRIKATNVGNYVVPPAYGEAMYDRSVIGRSGAGKLVVSRP